MTTARRAVSPASTSRDPNIQNRSSSDHILIPGRAGPLHTTYSSSRSRKSPMASSLSPHLSTELNAAGNDNVSETVVPLSDDPLFSICWGRQACGACLKSDAPCSWCPVVRISCRIALEDAIDTAYLRMLTQIDINVRAEPSASAYISAFRLVD